MLNITQIIAFPCFLIKQNIFYNFRMKAALVTVSFYDR